MLTKRQHKDLLAVINIIMGIFSFLNTNKRVSKNQTPKTLLKPDFDEININKLDNYYDSNTKLDQRELSIDINFETESITQSELNEILNFINSIPQFDLLNQKYIRSDLKSRVSMTSDYLNFYLEEFEEENLKEILKTEQKPNLKTLIEHLQLNRVGIYPSSTYFATFDYSIDIDDEPCNQLLVINLNKDGSLDHITWES